MNALSSHTCFFFIDETPSFNSPGSAFACAFDMSQAQSARQTLEAKPSKMATSLPISLLQLLQPGLEGEWKVTDQTQRSFVLSFIVKQGHESFHYTINPCLTKADVEKECAEFTYEWKNGTLMRTNYRPLLMTSCR
jgi:hypothetical protein